MNASPTRSGGSTDAAERTGTTATRQPARRFDRRLWARWLASFVGFPLAGLAATVTTGRIDSADAAVIGGLSAGAVLGAVQSLALRRSLRRRAAWTTATAFGLAVGLGIGAPLVGFATDTASLVAMGSVSGAGVGVAQVTVLRGPWARRLVWAVATTVLWGLGWLITSNVISDIDRQYATFGASGALVATALGGILLAMGADRGSRYDGDITGRSGAKSAAPRSKRSTTRTPLPGARVRARRTR